MYENTEINIVQFLNLIAYNTRKLSKHEYRRLEENGFTIEENKDEYKLTNIGDRYTKFIRFYASIEDEWFFLHYYNLFYKCDTIDGLIFKIKELQKMKL